MLIPVQGLCEICSQPIEDGAQNIVASITGEIVVKDGKTYLEASPDQPGSVICIKCEANL